MSKGNVSIELRPTTTSIEWNHNKTERRLQIRRSALAPRIFLDVSDNREEPSHVIRLTLFFQTNFREGLTFTSKVI